MSLQSQEDAVMRLQAKADEFQKHAARLAEVARQCAALSADARSEYHQSRSIVDFRRRVICMIVKLMLYFYDIKYNIDANMAELNSESNSC